MSIFSPPDAIVAAEFLSFVFVKSFLDGKLSADAKLKLKRIGKILIFPFLQLIND